MSGHRDSHVSLTTFLRAYASTFPADLQWMAAFDGWRELAAAEQRRRAQDFIQRLSTHEVVAIAQGKVNLAAIVRSIAREADRG